MTSSRLLRHFPLHLIYVSISVCQKFLITLLPVQLTNTQMYSFTAPSDVISNEGMDSFCVITIKFFVHELINEIFVCVYLQCSVIYDNIIVC
jgi:hypothetical protein